MPLPKKVFYFVSTCVSLDDSFPSVRQEPTLGPWKGSPFLQQEQQAQSRWLLPIPSYCTRFLEHCPVISPPTNQKKVTHPAAFPPDFAYKSFSLKTTGEFMSFLSTRHPFSLLGPAINLLLLQTDILVCLASLCDRHMNLRSEHYHHVYPERVSHCLKYS